MCAFDTSNETKNCIKLAYLTKYLPVCCCNCDKHNIDTTSPPYWKTKQKTLPSSPKQTNKPHFNPQSTKKKPPQHWLVVVQSPQLFVSKGPEFSLSLSTHRHFQGFLWRLETLFQAQRFGLHHKLFSKKVFNSGQFDKSLCYWNIQIYSRDGPIYC